MFDYKLILNLILYPSSLGAICPVQSPLIGLLHFGKQARDGDNRTIGVVFAPRNHNPPASVLNWNQMAFWIRIWRRSIGARNELGLAGNDFQRIFSIQVVCIT